MTDLPRLIAEFEKQTGDTPTHVLVDPKTAQGLPETIELSNGTTVDVAILIPANNYHWPQLPMCVTLPQTKGMKVFKIKEYEVSKWEKRLDWMSEHANKIWIGFLIVLLIIGAGFLLG